MTYPSQQDQYPPQPAAMSAAATGAAPAPAASAAQPPLRQLAGVAMAVSAGLAVGGSLVPHVYTAFFSADNGPGYTTMSNLWRTTVNYTGLRGTLPAQPGHSYIPGIPLMVGAALAVVAGVALLRAARYRGEGPRLWAVAAGGVLAGLAASDCLIAEATHSRQETLPDNSVLAAHYGAGMWLLMTAGLVAIGGAMAAALADRARGPQLTEPMGAAEPGGTIVYAIPADESHTPPVGFPAQPEPEP